MKKGLPIDSLWCLYVEFFTDPLSVISRWTMLLLWKETAEVWQPAPHSCVCFLSGTWCRQEWSGSWQEATVGLYSLFLLEDLKEKERSWEGASGLNRCCQMTDLVFGTRVQDSVLCFCPSKLAQYLALGRYSRKGHWTQYERELRDCP